MQKKQKIISIAGTTASGKSALAVALARKVNAEIISADSRQVYKDFNIGTAKITQDEMCGIKHYLIDEISPDCEYSAGIFVEQATAKINEIVKQGKIPIITGGTGLYLRMLLDGFDMPQSEPDVKLRADLNAKLDEVIAKLHSKGYKLSLNVTLKTLELPDEMYALFDYFQFDVTFFDQNFDDISHSSLTMKRSIEKVLKYHKKVIVSSVETWNDVELRVQENLKLLSGSVISPYSEMILPINKKVIEKIKKIKKRG